MIKNKQVERHLSSEAQQVKSLQKQILALQGSLKDEQLKAEAMSTMIDIAEKAYKIEIRKKS